jgi:predicted transcriptional regulator of viral defense system
MSKISQYVLNHLPYDLFTDTDLASMIPASRDSRYGLVKRAIKNGEIIRLKRGLYCLAKENRRRGLNAYAVSQLLCGPSYVSLESALSYHGWVPEGVFLTTCVGMMRSVTYKTPVGDFSYHHVPQRCFYEDVEPIAADEGDYFMAKPLKALCDYIYIHKRTWSGIKPLCDSLRIDEESVAQLTGEQCDRLYENYRSRRVRAFIKGVKKDLGL